MNVKKVQGVQGGPGRSRGLSPPFLHVRLAEPEMYERGRRSVRHDVASVSRLVAAVSRLGIADW